MDGLMRTLECKNCGGTIDRRTMKCPYCDTQYERQHGSTMVQFAVERPGVHVIRAQAMVADEIAMRNPEAAAKIAEDQLRRSLADGLLDYMRCVTTVDPRRCCRIIRGEVRVVEPS